MTGSVKSKHAGDDSSAFGLALMLGYLGFDGFTSTFQDKLFKGYQMTIYNQILCEWRRPGGVLVTGCPSQPGQGRVACPSACSPGFGFLFSEKAALGRPELPLRHWAARPTRSCRCTACAACESTCDAGPFSPCDADVTSFSATFSLLGLISAGQLMPAIRCALGP
jgi:hypothetical protein